MPFIKPRLAKFDAMRRVHIQQANRGAAGGRQPNDLAALQAEVKSPIILSRIEEANDLTAFRIDAREVGSFVKVAQMACPGKSFQVVCFDKVLLRDDMIDVESEVGRGCLRDEAVLATITRTMPDQVAEPIIHFEPVGRLDNVEPSTE